MARAPNGSTGAAPPADGAPRDAFGGCLIRILWTVVGNATLLIVAMMILQEPPWAVGLKDVAFFAVLAGVIGLRYVEVMRLDRSRQVADPITPRQLVRFAFGLSGFWIVVWAVARSFHVASASGSM
jgi:hypothetical protein